MDLIEQLIRIKDSLTRREDRDAINEACAAITRLRQFESFVPKIGG